MRMIPQDPVMAMSYINTKLRDEYDSLEDLCGDLGEDPEDVIRRLSGAGFAYDEEQRRFR